MISNKSLTITILFILSLVGAYSIYKPFLLSIVVAMLLTMATYNFTKKLNTQTGSRNISAAVATLSLVLIIFAPIIYLATVGVGYAAQSVSYTTSDAADDLPLFLLFASRRL